MSGLLEESLYASSEGRGETEERCLIRCLRGSTLAIHLQRTPIHLRFRIREIGSPVS